MEKVKAGDAVVIRASTWNAFIDAANFTQSMKQNQFGKGLKSGYGSGIVPVKNTESTACGQFAALVLNGICVKPEANEDEFLSCPATFEGVKMTAEREGKPYAITLEPIGAGEVGRAMLLGLTPAKVTIGSVDDEYAVPKPGSSTGELESSPTGVARILWKAANSGLAWCILQLGGAGSGAGEDKALMCKVTSGSVTAGYQVTVYPNGRSDEGSAYQALMFLPDVALDADLPAGTWVIGHKCAIASTGGNET